MTDPASESGTGGTSRGAKVAVAMVVGLGLVALYVALGGPIPFVPEGGPALDSVPADADVVVYTDAWTFSSETSRNVADGILTVSNESLPGYTGPASLGSAFEALGETSLDPQGLRSVTAFGNYDEAGRVGADQGMVIKTTWSRTEIQTAFGGSPDAYEQQRYRGQRVYALPGNESILPWLARLEGGQFVLGTESAVKGAIDAHAGRDGGMNETLRSRFDDLDRGSVRFVASMPESIPGRSIVPEDAGRTIDAIETVGGVYYPDGEDATVELVVGTRDESNASRLRPAMDGALAVARPAVPNSTRTLFDGATVEQSGTSVTLSMTGPVDAFLDGYRALIETGLVTLLAGEPVGEPALELVPGDAEVVGYADAGLVTDPTAQGLFERALSADAQPDGTVAEGVFRALETLSVSELTSFRSVTVFGRGIETDSTDAAAIVQARLTDGDVEAALSAANTSYRRTTAGTRTVYVVTEDTEPVWIAPLGEDHLVLGSASAVSDVIDVTGGAATPVAGALATAIGNGTSYLRVASVVPSSVTDAAGPLSEVVADVEVIAASYDTVDDRVLGRVDLHFGTESRASDGERVITALLSLGGGSVDDERLRTLLESATVTQDGRVVTLTAETDPETLLAAVDRLAGLAGDEQSATARAVAPTRPTTLLPGHRPPAGESP